MGNTEPGLRRRRDGSPVPEYGQGASALSVRRSSQESFVAKESNELSRIQFIRHDENSIEKTKSRKASARKSGREKSAKSSGGHALIDVCDKNGAVQLT